MKNYLKISYLFLALVLGVVVYQFFRTNSKFVSENQRTSAAQLVNSFIANEAMANSIYKSKLIEIEGIVKKVSFLNGRATVFLSANNISSVLCDMEASQLKAVQKLQKDQKVKLKGLCKGFLNDVIVLNCTLINSQNQ